jgi:hypothetical protein
MAINRLRFALTSSGLLLALCGGAGCADDDGGAECGPNTELVDGTCQVSASACGSGSSLNASNGSCEVGGAPEGATLVAEASSQAGTAFNTYHLLASMEGDTPVPLATDLFTEPTASDDVEVHTSSGRPINEGLLPVSSFGLSEQMAPTNWDGATGSGATQPTLAMFKACKHDLKIYKLQSGLYRVRYTITNCLPAMLYTFWMLYTPTTPADPTNIDDFRATHKNFMGVISVGGMPHTLVSDMNGYAFKEVDIDPNFFFKAGEPCGGGFACTPVPPAGPPASFPIPADGGVFFGVQIHTTGQNNGNAGSCYLKEDGTCIGSGDEYPASPPYDQHILWVGRDGDDAAHIASLYMPLSILQP